MNHSEKQNDQCVMMKASSFGFRVVSAGCDKKVFTGPEVNCAAAVSSSFLKDTNIWCLVASISMTNHSEKQNDSVCNDKGIIIWFSCCECWM